jgi:hypothetical protein
LPSLYCEDDERLSLKLRGKVSAPEGEVGTQSRWCFRVGCGVL